MDIKIQMPIYSFCDIGHTPETRVPGYNPVIIIDGKKFTCNMEYAMRKQELDKFIEDFNRRIQ